MTAHPALAAPLDEQRVSSASANQLSLCAKTTRPRWGARRVRNPNVGPANPLLERIEGHRGSISTLELGTTNGTTAMPKKAESPAYAGLSYSGGGIRTRDLRVMRSHLMVLSGQIGL